MLPSIPLWLLMVLIIMLLMLCVTGVLVFLTPVIIFVL